MNKFSSRLSLVFALLFLGLFLSIAAMTQRARAYYTNMPASVVVGQSDFTSNLANQGGSAGANTLNLGWHAVTNGQQLVVSDLNNNRLLVFNSIPDSNNTSADVVIGQTDFSGTSANQGGTADANTLNSPRLISVVGDRIFVADKSNNRVLIWNSIPTTNNASADVVVGQSTMTGTSSGTTSTTLNSLAGVDYDHVSGKLVIADQNNRRVLIYNSLPTSNGAAADVVVGQQNFTSGSVNQGGSAAANTLRNPRHAIIRNGKLIIADTENNRVLIYNSIPTQNNASADIVIGQINFTQTSGNQGGSVNAATLNGPQSVESDGKRLYIADGNSRILIYNSIPTTNNAQADVVLGQTDLSSNGSSGTTASSVNPNGVSVFGKYLFSNDSGNRILIFHNVFSTPIFNKPTISALPDSKLRISGIVGLGERGRYSLQKIQVNLNGQGLTNVNFHGGTDDGLTTTRYEWDYDFEPWAGVVPKDMYSPAVGYTLYAKASSFNAEDNSFFLFTPFTLSSIAYSARPIFNFTVHQKGWSRLRDNLSSYSVQYRTQDINGNIYWRTYIDKIPVDSSKGTNGEINIKHDSENGVISVSSKEKILPVNANTFRIIAQDNWGHSFNISNEITVNVNRDILSTIYSNTKDWFPLQLSSISGASSKTILSVGLPITDKLDRTIFSVNTLRPTFKGIAFSNTTINISVIDKDSSQIRSYAVNVIDSKWSVTPTLFKNSYVNISVTDIAKRYIQFPTLTLTVN